MARPDPRCRNRRQAVGRTSNPGLVDGWFASHPTEEGRIADTQSRIAAINPAVLRTLTIDSQGFQNFKARVRSLPAAR